MYYSSVIPTEKEYTTKARLGQEKFREDLMKVYGCVCAVTGISNPKLLVASHIKPWRYCNSEQRRDPDNGLLLSALADRLFDTGLVTFDGSGQVVTSSQLGNLNELICGTINWKALNFSAKQKQYMEFHREFVLH